MKLTAFLGSPRAGGNTDILASRILDGARDAGLQTETAALRDLKIVPCDACDRCWSGGLPCVQQDDMTPLYGTIGEADILLFATPVYWYGPTAIMKAFVDRLIPLNRPPGRPLIQGKGALLVAAYEETGPAAAEPLVRMFELAFAYLQVRFIDQVVVDGVGPKGAVLHKPEALDRAYAVGRALKDWSAP